MVSPLWLRWVKNVGTTPAPLAERPQSFTCHCSNTVMEQSSKKSQHTKLTLEKNISPTAPVGIPTHNLSITSLALLQTSYPGSLILPVQLGQYWVVFSFQNKWLYRAPNFLSFKGVPSPLPRFFRGYFHPLFINLEGITACLKVLNFHNTWVNKILSWE